VSALDVSVQSQVVNLLVDLKEKYGSPTCSSRTTCPWSSTSATASRCMYLGEIVETAKSEDLYRRPLHPYTKALLSAVPVPTPNASAAASS